MAYSDIDTTNWTPGTVYWTKLTATDHAGWLYIITLLSFVYVLIAFAIRFFVKWGMYGLDDWALLGSTVLAIGQYVAVLVALGKGLGKSGTLLGPEQMSELATYASAHAFLYILAHCLSKVSTALLTFRLFENGRPRNRFLSFILVATSLFFGFGSILALSIKCPNPYLPTCSHRFTRWQIIMAFDIISESFLVLVPLILILDILINKRAKTTVLAVFGFRLADVVFAAMNLHRIGMLGSSTDKPLDVIPSMMWTQTELLWSILAASLPCLKAFMKPFDKIDEDARAWRSKNAVYGVERSVRAWDWGGRDESFVFQDMRSKPREEVVMASGSDCVGFDFGLRPDTVSPSHEVEISHPTSDVESNGRRSWGSQDHIIKTHTRFEVKSEGGRNLYELP